MSSDIASSVKLLVLAAAASNQASHKSFITPNSMAAQKIIDMNMQRAALGRAHCELTALQGCSEIKRPSGRPATRPFTQCGHSVSITGGFCSLNSMNGCINPLMATRLNDMFGNDSVVDLGAGQGQYGILADSMNGGSHWYSVDSTENIYALTQGSVHFADLTAPADIQGIEPADWAVCIEAAEHIPRSSQAALIANLHFLNRKGVVLSWALPNQPGSHHVNCRTNAYVEHLFHSLGYMRDHEREADLRDAIAATLDRSALASSKSGRAPPFEFWGKLNNTVLKAEVAKVIQLIPRHKARLVSLAACPWLYDTLMVFRRTHPVVGYPALNRAQLLRKLEAEQQRIDDLLSKVTNLRDQLSHHPGTIGLHGLKKEEQELLRGHVQREASKVFFPGRSSGKVTS
jgi:hypothetical protein